MPIVRFIGRVVPPAVSVGATNMPELNWKYNEAGMELKLRIGITGSYVAIEIESDRYDHAAHFVEFHKRASDVARTTVNLVAFATGIGMTVMLDRVILPDGTFSKILLQDPTLPPLCTALNIQEGETIDLRQAVLLVMTEPPLFRALNDLIESIVEYHVSCVNCGRVVDSIRRMITPPNAGKSDRAAWLAMREALNVSQPYQEWITQQSTGPRHGDPAFVPGSITTEVVRRTWTLMNRFLEYRKRGNTPLTAPEFPLLI